MTDVPARASPRDRVRAVLRSRSEATLAGACVAVLRTGSPPADEDVASALGGVHGRHQLERTEPARADQTYWWRTWALRVLLYAWDDLAEPDVTAALADDAWRVREMAAKVVALREVGMAAGAAAAAVSDPIPRVRAAALRAVAVVGEREHVDVVRAALRDPEPTVTAQAERALEWLGRRLDL
jgi:HEAT repeat protein